MKTPTLEEIDESRKNGFRPGVVMCCLNSGRVLLLWSENHKMWQLPQGRISNKTDLGSAVAIKLTEELGGNFVDSAPKEFEVLGYEEIEFASHKHGLTELKTDEGEAIVMKGKGYYFVAIQNCPEVIDLSDTDYQDYHYLPYENAKFLIETIPQPQKREMTLSIIELLKKENLLS